MKIQLKTTEAHRAAEFVATGIELASRITLEVNPTALTSETRSQIVEAQKENFIMSSGHDEQQLLIAEPGGWGRSRRDVGFFAANHHKAEDAQAIFDEYFVALENGKRAVEMAVAAKQAEREAALQEKLARFREILATPDLTLISTPGGYRMSVAPDMSLFKDLPAYASEAQPLLDELERRYVAAREAWDAENAGREAAKAAVAEKLAVEKKGWIEVHGSERLKKAVRLNYSCQRCYVVERAALELPGFEVDFDNNAEWKAIACPKEAMLDEVIALRDRGLEAEVVYLTAEVDPDEYGDSEGRAALVVENYLGRYTLVK